MRALLILVGLLLVALGAGCLNYSKAETLDHHREWAQERGMPPPSATVMWTGAGALAGGGFIAAVGMGRCRRDS